MNVLSLDCEKKPNKKYWPIEPNELAREIIVTYADLLDFFGSTEMEHVETSDGGEMLRITFHPLVEEDLDEVWEEWRNDNPSVNRERPTAEDFNDVILDILGKVN